MVGGYTHSYTWRAVPGLRASDHARAGSGVEVIAKIRDVRYCMWKGYTFTGLAKQIGVDHEELRELIRLAWR